MQKQGTPKDRVPLMQCNLRAEWREIQYYENEITIETKHFNYTQNTVTAYAR